MDDMCLLEGEIKKKSISDTAGVLVGAETLTLDPHHFKRGHSPQDVLTPQTTKGLLGWLQTHSNDRYISPRDAVECAIRVYSSDLSTYALPVRGTQPIAIVYVSIAVNQEQLMK